MSGTFSSFSTGLSAMRYNQVAMDVASGNVANAGTPGYARRQVIGQATGAPDVPARWSRWEGAGDGVQAGGVNRMVDPLLDARARTEHASASSLDARATSLVRFETTLGEPGDNGVAAALAAFKQGWHDVANNPADGAARSQLITRGQTLASAINTQARAVDTEWSDQRTRLDATATEVNQVAGNLAKLNSALQAAYVGGNDAGTLLDQRDQLALRLAELTGARTTINADTTVTVQLGDPASPVTLVDKTTATPVTVQGAPDLAGSAANPVQVLVGGVPTPVTSGEMGGVHQVLTQDLPDYMSKLDAFAVALRDAVNTQHHQGADQNGNQGGDFFAGTSARTLGIAPTLTGPAMVAAADLSKIDPADPNAGRYDGSNAEVLGSADLAGGQYRSLISSFGVTVSSAKQVSANQGVLAAQVDASREALSGINVDEEMVNLLAAQRGYEGAARVLTTVDSMLDTLINRTGLVGR
jgi:flagellar hook-associated protein 1 FlgK